MSKEPVRRKSDGKVRMYGLGWVSPGTATLIVIVTIVLIVLILKGY